MIGKTLSLCAAVCFYLYAVGAQSDVPGYNIPRTRFTCSGRPSGYYADMDTGCQVYHMCDGLGRQFSYTCPNTTLFQQRMLVCDHWYMVNCSMSERDYDANLLIGQRDKPFVSDEEMRQRTPRPDILSVPLNNNYYDGLKEAESKFPLHPGNSITGETDSIKHDNNGLDSGKTFRPPTGWSTQRPRPDFSDIDTLEVSASQRPNPTIQPPTRPTTTPIPAPSIELIPPFTPSTTESSEEVQIDIRMNFPTDSVINFINRFDPDSTVKPKTDTVMTRTEIINLNKQLPDGPANSEEDRAPIKNKNFSNINKVQNGKDKSFTDQTKFDTKGTTNSFPVPEKVLVPPKSEFSNEPTTTVGPPIYYEWKWAVPAFDLEPPKQGNDTNDTVTATQAPSQGRSPFRDVTRPTQPSEDPTPAPKNVEYNISSYFVPDYVFPLDKPHPGYEDNDAQTSFQVRVGREGKTSFGENMACPQCHPAYLKPGSCEPCIVRR